ncbi:FAD-dependent oxidoreductase [Nonomuraea sp. NN258]|nr:FAD-dependent oxidoreductase [Nonomuraea antri]
MSGRRSCLRDLASYLRWLGETEPGLEPLAASGAHLDAYCYAALTTGLRTPGRPLAPSTVAGRRARLASFYAFAWRHGATRSPHPVNGASPLTRTERRLLRAGVARLAETGRTAEALAVALLESTGASVAALAALTTDDLHPQPGDGHPLVITVRESRDGAVAFPIPPRVGVLLGGVRDALTPGARAVIVGAGWIGAEVATAAAGKGCLVTVVEAADLPLAAVLGPEIGGLIVGWYEELGVELRTGTKVASVDPGGVRLADGDFLAADVVVTGVGVRPEVGWLAGSGIEVGAGVVVDGSLRTSRPEVVAVGDCAAWWSARYGRRLSAEHWDTALNAPDVAAAALLGQEAVYDPVPYIWSEQFGRMVQYVGHHSAADRLVFRGDPGASAWTALWLSDDRLRAVLAVDRPRDVTQGRRLIAGGAPVALGLIVDPDVALSSAARVASAGAHGER